MADIATNYANLQQARLADGQVRAADSDNGQPPAATAQAARMSAITAMFLILVALGIDGIQAFLNFIIIGVVVNWIIGIFAWLLFFVWLHSLGITMSEAKGMRTLLFLGLAFGFEVLPILKTLPRWTAFALWAVINEFGSAALQKVGAAKYFIRKKEQ